MTELPAGMTHRWHKTSLTISQRRACIAKHSQTALWRWQIPSFVPGRESQGTPGAHASRMERSRLPRGLWGCPGIASMPCLASAARGHAALWEPGSGQRRCPSRGVVLSDAVAMRCARMTAALNSAHHDPHPPGTRPSGAQRTSLLSCVATSPVLLWACWRCQAMRASSHPTLSARGIPPSRSIAAKTWRIPSGKATTGWNAGTSRRSFAPL